MSVYIELLWPDGAITTGKDWGEVESALRAAQWTPYKTRREFRRDLRKRAENWSGRKVRTGAWRTSESFIKSLAEAGMFIINVDNPNVDERERNPS